MFYELIKKLYLHQLDLNKIPGIHVLDKSYCDNDNTGRFSFDETRLVIKVLSKTWIPGILLRLFLAYSANFKFSFKTFLPSKTNDNTGRFSFDETRLVIKVDGLRMSGFQVYYEIRKNYNIQSKSA